MSRDRYPAGGTARDREAWARRQIALAFGMRPHEAMLFLQGAFRETFGQGKRAGVALASTPPPPPAAPEAIRAHVEGSAP